MPNILNDLGLQIKTREEIVTDLSNEMKAIYGNDIDISSNTPDGQLINIVAQAIVDVLELVMQVYTSFDPDQAIGVTLAQRGAINGIQPQGGTYTTQIVDVLTNASGFILPGLDVSEDDAYTVEDNAGTRWKLINSFNVPTSGTHSLNFRAELAGEQLSLPNTITVPVTININVVSVNNPLPYTVLGIDQESDFDFKVRRQKSVSLPSQGFYEGLLADLENLPGVVSAHIYENRTGDFDNSSVTSTYPFGTPGHCIWVIVDGAADNEAIATSIYRKRNSGANMRGDDTFVITQVDGSPFQVRWDFASPEPLFIKFNVTSLNGIQDVNYEAIRTQLPELFVPGVFEQLNVNDLATDVQRIDPNALVTSAGMGLSETGPFDNVAIPSSRDKKFTVQYENIIMLPIIVRPGSSTVNVNETRQMRAYGGWVDPTVTFVGWNFSVNPNGSTIDSTTGLFTAASTPGTCTVRYTDDLGNTAEAIITVV